MVGVKGLEPSAPWSQTKYSNHTELHPDLHIKQAVTLINEAKL